MADEISRSTYRNRDCFLNAVSGGTQTFTDERGESRTVDERTDLTISAISAQTIVVQNLASTPIKLYVTSRNAAGDDRVEIPYFLFANGAFQPADSFLGTWLSEGERLFIPFVGAYDVNLEAKQGQARVGWVSSPCDMTALIEAFSLSAILESLGDPATKANANALSTSEGLLADILCELKHHGELLEEIVSEPEQQA